MELPVITTYGPYAGNYGSHALRVDIGPITVWYSYQTPVAFRVSGHPIVVRRNDWGPTTGKHLNAIDGGNKSDRVDSEDFQRLWDKRVVPLLSVVT